MSDVRVLELPVPGLEEMQAEARAECVNFIDRLANEWAAGVNRFDGPGELLCGIFDQGRLVAVGGLNRDPFLADPSVGRIRRVYVRREWRQRGFATAMVHFLIERARENFGSVRLRAETPYAARLYERLGFSPIDDPEATHIMALSSAAS